MLGLKLSPVSPDRLGAGSPYRGGLEVSDVRPDSPAARQSIRAGDILVGLHVWETTSLENVEFVLGHAELATFTPLKFYVERRGESMFGFINLDALSSSIKPERTRSTDVQKHEPAGIDPAAAKILLPAYLRPI